MNYPVKDVPAITDAALVIVAPCRGVIVPLTDIPDAAFASGTLGPGLGIEPLEGVLHAPCDGEVIAISRTRHAITLRAGNGAEILLHAGIDTVRLDGEGFEPRVMVGDRVATGDPLLTLDLDLIAGRAPSLCTPLIILDGSLADDAILVPSGLVETGTPILQLAAGSQPGPADTAEGDDQTVTASILIEMADGIHARPAAQIARCAKAHQGLVRISTGTDSVNGKSVAGLMGLGVKHGDRVEISVTGADADKALTALLELIRDGAGDEIVPLAANGDGAATANTAAPARVLSGVAASAGVVVGPLAFHVGDAIDVPDQGDGPAVERTRLSEGLAALIAEIDEEACPTRGEQAALLAAHAEMADDPDMIDAARLEIATGRSAGRAWQVATAAQIAQLEATGDKRTSERVADLRDVEARLLRTLYGACGATDLSHLNGAILVAEDLLPSDFMRYAAAGIAGLALSAGGATSHVAILAAAENIPALVSLGRDVLRHAAGAMALIDTAACRLEVEPGDEEVARIQAKAGRRREAEALAALAAGDAARTRDGQRIHVMANLASVDEAASALRNGAEGCGLLRTEFLFTHRRQAPDEAEQAEVYTAIAQCLKGHPLTIRTLDIGGDKPVPFLDLGDEPNPALGLRGIRTLTAHPQIMRDQVRALLKAAKGRDVLVMLPMVSGPSEVTDFRAVVRDLAREMEIETLPKIGTMIETPASAVIADQICRVADFVSIGTNDLTQYTLAMDRGHAALAGQMDALHPAVVALIGQVGAAAGRADIPASVCGGLASDPLAVPVLIGLGIGKLSVVQSMIGPIKAIVRDLDAAHCREFARELHTLDSAAEIRARIVAEWPQLDCWL
ncbi:phosphoenolpyruvate--protein phosphotransferase [Maricaulis maris]|uniref:phosphoenolpyruvate--protein phosphotransferase n=1 Tax=Maricaulis maris TaxID=74318 RepID=A0A495DDF7_9PROT|nr:phosphoenolpyruvate--protein phosphotransferase [Maricaulis maris]RKR00331.1 phosphocarrier protein HPr /phosphoenolpyruvate--protein phosphotransferase /PTS system IIA component (Glc family) [Maricaulis maris]